MEGSKGRDWLRNSFYAAFIIAFAIVISQSLEKLVAGNTLMSQEAKAMPDLLYPSVTICPYSRTDFEGAGFPLRADETNLSLADRITFFSHSYETDGRYETSLTS